MNEQTSAKSYYAEYRAISGYLLGGIKSSRSSRCTTRELAESLLQATIENNEGNATGSVVASDKPAQLCGHCVPPAQLAYSQVCKACAGKATP